MRKLVLLTVALGAVVLPAMASAHRKPTSTERVAIHKAELADVQGPARHIPARCEYMDIATVVPGSTWAATVTNSRRLDHDPGCKYEGQGITVLHKVQGHWKLAGSGPIDGLLAHFPGVPSRVTRDLVRGLPASDAGRVARRP